jgi:hypothetical protein
VEGHLGAQKSREFLGAAFRTIEDAVDNEDKVTREASSVVESERDPASLPAHRDLSTFFTVTSGTCTIQAECILSPNYPNEYPASSTCDISLNAAGMLSFEDFYTPTDKDVVTITTGGVSTAYSGFQTAASYYDVTVASGATFAFAADATQDGYYEFKVCYQDGGSLVPTTSPAPSLMPTSFDFGDDDVTLVANNVLVITIYMAIFAPVLLFCCWCCSPGCAFFCVGAAPKPGRDPRGGCCDVADGSEGKSIRSYSIIGFVTYLSTALIVAICYYWAWGLLYILYSSSEEIEEFCHDYTDDDGDDLSSDVSEFCTKMQDSIEYFFFGVIVAGIAHAVYIFVFLRLFGCCCCFSAVNKWGFRLSSFVMLVAIALSVASAICMNMAYSTFEEALDQWIESDNKFWDQVADIFLGFTIAVLLPAFFVAPLEFLVCKASFAEREDAADGEINNDVAGNEKGPSGTGL